MIVFRAQIGSMALSEVGAAVSVLLGFAPPVTLSASSSLKVGKLNLVVANLLNIKQIVHHQYSYWLQLNEVLVPNPFDRPRSVVILEVTGAEGMQAGMTIFHSTLTFLLSFSL